jgi:hypothetical protein
VLDARYARLASQWLTPVEIFKPHYAAAIARYLLKEMDPGYPLTVYELGGGMGTCAAGILVGVVGCTQLSNPVDP